MFVVITLSGQRFRAHNMADAQQIAAALWRSKPAITGPWKRKHR
jgi:hypothetical protein